MNDTGSSGGTVDRFTQAFDAAVAGEPQVITKHGKPVAVLLAHDEWLHLTEQLGRGGGS